MKTVHFASILALVAMTAFACGSDDDAPIGDVSAAGEAGEHSGSAGKGNGGGAGTANGNGGAAQAEAGAGGATELPIGGNGGAPAEAGAGGAELAGGAGTGGAPSAEPLEIIGNWIDDFDSLQVIDNTSWNSATILEYDNDANVVYAQNSPDDEYNPSKFTKTVYTEPANDSFYFCLIVYNAATLADAKADTTVADDTDPESSGCGGFAWSKATRQ